MQSFQRTTSLVFLCSALTCVLSGVIVHPGSPTTSPSTEESKPSLHSDVPAIRQDTPSKSPDSVLPTIHKDGLPYTYNDPPIKPSDDSLPTGHDLPSTPSDDALPYGLLHSPMKDPDISEDEDSQGMIDEEDYPSKSDSPDLHSPMEDPDVFEGDMAISQDMIDEYY